MAKTKTKKAVEKVEEKIDVIIPESLHPDHLLKIETSQRDIENAKLLMAVEEQTLRNLHLEFELLKNKIEKQSQLVSHCSQKYELQKTKFFNYKKEIWPLYGLSINEGLSYDPITGLIKR